MKLRDLLSDKLGLKTQLRCSGDIVTVYENFMFAIKIKAPNQIKQTTKFTVQEYLGMVGIHNYCFSGVCNVVHKWLSSQFLSKSIEERVVDIIVATMFAAADDDISNANSSSIVTVENGFLQFLKLLSFTDFSNKFLVLGSTAPGEIDATKLAKFEYDFRQKRNQYPELTIISKLDWDSTWTRNLSKPYLTRLVNC